jgi:hypothetical protein
VDVTTPLTEDIAAASGSRTKRGFLWCSVWGGMSRSCRTGTLSAARPAMTQMQTPRQHLRQRDIEISYNAPPTFESDTKVLTISFCAPIDAKLVACYNRAPAGRFVVGHLGFMDLTDYKQFWRGELSLGQAFWIMYFGINFALGFAVLLAMFILSLFKIQMLVNLAYFGGVVIISAYTLWATVGMWRCSPIRRKDGKASFIWPIVVKIIVIFSSISAISSLVEVLKHPLNPS